MGLTRLQLCAVKQPFREEVENSRRVQPMLFGLCCTVLQQAGCSVSSSCRKRERDYEMGSLQVNYDHMLFSVRFCFRNF